MVEKTVENGDIFYLTFSSIKNIVLARFSTNSEIRLPDYKSSFAEPA